jgi:hypothetical protein
MWLDGMAPGLAYPNWKEIIEDLELIRCIERIPYKASETLSTSRFASNN